MATAREHFALDWIKADLLETLNEARIALDDYAEQSGDETRMRACLTSLHQVHGTLVMLELKGVTQLADHLEQLAQAVLAGKVDDLPGAAQTLMQGILELPGYLDELQRGGHDSISTSMSLVNELRAFLNMEALVDPAGGSLREGASDAVIARFNAIGGPEKVARIRSAYQNVLLSILKGEDRAAAVNTLGKIAIGLEKVTEGAPLERQWQAFAEFVTSLGKQSGALESEAVKLLRRVDLEIKYLAKDGESILRRPVNVDLVGQLLDGAVARDNRSTVVSGLREAVDRDVFNNTLAISGRQALRSAATALQEDLSVIKDRLDLLVRAKSIDLEQLRHLIMPLKQIGSTLSLLGFESSREIVADQIDTIENLVVLSDSDPLGVESIAAALVQIDENLSSVILGSDQTEVEQITSEAQLQVLREARKNLDFIKQCVVDFVTAHWSVGHLEAVIPKLGEICGALEIIPLKRAIGMLERVSVYVESQLLQGHQPEWQELDRFADVVSALDYYLERMADETSAGAEDILQVAERSLVELEALVGDAVVESQVEQAPVAEIEEIAELEPAALEEAPQPGIDQEPEPEPEVETETEQAVAVEPAEEQPLDIENLPALDEPKLVLEQDAGFDLSTETFAELDGAIENDAQEAQEDNAPEEPAAFEHADPEIVEIFVEEIDEVLENIAMHLPLWAQNFDNADALTEVRRGFHTLKGSGRIVQAVAISELAWGIENMLNRVIEGTVSADAQFVTVIDAATHLVPSLRDAFARGTEGDLDVIGAIIDQADVLSSGGELDATNLTAPEPSEAPHEEVFEEVVAADDVQLEPVQQASADADSVEESTALDFFVAEARKQLRVIEQENACVPWTLSEPLSRAYHSLAGSAALAEIAEVQLIVEPAYQVVEAFSNVAPNTELQQFFVAAATHLNDCLNAYSAHEVWEEPLEFVALADDLLATRSAAPGPANQLIDAPVTAALFDAEEALSAYLAAGVGGSDSANANLQAVLHELAGLAGEMKATPLSDLARALAQALGAAAASEQLPATCVELMRTAYDTLIDQLSEIAAGTDVGSRDELIVELAALDFSLPQASPVPEPERPEAEDAKPADELIKKSEITELAEFDPDLVQVFFEEADEINEQLEANILNWSRESDNRLFMENMLRGLHTLKGGARLCGLSQLGDMAHNFESIVIEVQTNERKTDAALFTELNRRYDEIAKHLAMLNDEVDIVIATIDRSSAVELTSSEVVEQSAPGGEDFVASDDVNASSTATSDQQQAAAASAPKLVPKQPVVEAPTTPERSNSEMVRVGSGLLEELVNLAGESSILRARMEQGMTDFAGALDEMETTIERLREQLRRLEIETETQILHRYDRTDGPQYDNFDPLEMDRYNQMQQLSRSLSESASDMTDLKETLLYKARESETLLLQQARINTELQEGLMRTRMVPVSRLMPRLRRIVRQVSAELGKEVDFHVQNADGELDRNLLERMVPPLEHMLRNAVDHGIESVELRRSFGKPAAGRVDLRLTREGGDVVIEVGDDGAGIDVEGVRAKAIERGLMTKDADLSDEEVLQFVLAPGFTTAKLVTQISGRGVGLDVVRSEVKQLGGSINIVSLPGRGTRFILRVPFTVSVNRALMVSIAEDQYAIPLNTIEGIVLLNPDQLQALYSSEGKTFEYAGIPYRVRYLGQYLGRGYRGSVGGQSSVPMVLVRSGDQAIAIHVDQVHGSREIVVKSLGPQFAGVGGISGATILGDGSVVVILDLLALIRAQHIDGARRSVQNVTPSNGPRCVMVVDDSVTVRKVTSRLLERQGMEVLVAKDGVEAVALLQERRPDIILLDIEMPRMDGFEVARQVRHDERLRDLPIVMISSRTGDKHKEHANQLGVDRFLGKPFQESELLATIDELVTRN